MLRYLLAIILHITLLVTVQAQKKPAVPDSAEVKAHLAYNDVSNAHRRIFGENYRDEWAATTKLPLLKISAIAGGLQPIKLGGGHQSVSLRLKDKAGNEWVLRGIEKQSGSLAPDVIKGSLYEKWLNDNFSAQHPYSALIVPVLADAVRVPHTNPIIGVVAPDKAFGDFAKLFVGTVCLLEEHDPIGDSDNTIKMLRKLDKDNDNKLDSAVFFRARLLDLLIADWGRHEDQWRWIDRKPGGGKDYLVVPRDRDQVFYTSEGILPKAAAKTSILSFLEGFNAKYKDVNAFFINGARLNQQLLNQYSHKEWMQMTEEFVAALPDEVLMRALDRLPTSSQNLRKDALFQKLQGRRDNMLQAMDTYYRFLYKIIDIRTSDKTELAEFTEGLNGQIDVQIYKLSAGGKKEQVLFSNSFVPEITKEIRLFTGKGDDEIRLNVPSGSIKIRVIGGDGEKKYNLIASRKKIAVYENGKDDTFIDADKRLQKHLSDDSLTTRKVFTNMYANKSGVFPTADLRSVDGLFLGLGYKITKEGFRKEPYGNMQRISVLKSLNSKAIQLTYKSEWKSVFKHTDITIEGLADIKGNSMNFFGRGNNSFLDKSRDINTYYRTNFSYYQLEPALKFHLQKAVSLSVGPSFQHFSFNPADNEGRFINTTDIINQFNYLQENKSHAGLFLELNWDTRNNKLLPAKGLNLELRIHGYEGLNHYSDAYAQLFPQVSFYKSLDSKRNLVLANRTGAGFSVGKPAFYQNAFLGSQGNLLGFEKFRFAGNNLVYNNFEARLAIPNFLGYFLPGKMGLVGFYDIGRVWIKDDDSDSFHQGYGAGLYLALFNQLLIRGNAGFSKEGMRPTVTLKQRF